ncbi:hypothetical protein ACIP9C_15885 [Lysinibacillus sp. NPDC093210]|uniref:hypothetical protein n=1 Tax=Lysinibacillus sp. NPDC093210 TaxID=3364133 RepID=UPI003825B0B0
MLTDRLHAKDQYGNPIPNYFLNIGLTDANYDGVLVHGNFSHIDLKPTDENGMTTLTKVFID